MSLLITPYHTLSPSLETRPIPFGEFKISSISPNFLSHLITPCHFFSHLTTPYPLGWKQHYFHLTTLILAPRQAPIFLSHLITPSHSLSHLITPYPLGLKPNQSHLATLKLVLKPLVSYHVLSRLATAFLIFSHLIHLVANKIIFIWQLYN